VASIAKDTDGDGLSDDLEQQIGTSVTLKDSDRDGGSDYDEVRLECDPTDPKHRIIKLGEWQKSNGSLNLKSRKATVSYDGKIVEKTDTMVISMPIEHSSYFFALKNKQANKEMMSSAIQKSNAYMAEREKYLELSSKYEEIKRLRSENSRLMKVYYSDKSKENLDAWNKVRLPLVELEKKEYEDAKLRVAAARYAPKNRMEELEDRVEELEDEVDSLRNR
jgi:hypothetical protein